jgi:GMP synthase-like glutamine amidotransferase
MPLRVLVFQHEASDGPGYLGEALEKRGAALDIVRLDLGQPLPDPADYDMLLVLGGEMNVYAEAEFPWLAAETRLLRRAVEAGQPVLGLCLGGQLLARALGAQVHVGATHEVGLATIDLNAEGQADPLFAGLPAPRGVEWHDDTFDIPAGAVPLAGSAQCASQAFRYGSCYGLQFHPECSPDMLAEWIESAGDSARADTAAFQQAVDSEADALRAQAACLADNFLRQAGLGESRGIDKL